MKSIPLLLLFLAAGSLHADVNLGRVPESWTPTPAPAGLIEALQKRNITCERFFTRTDGNATLAYNTYKTTWTYSQSSHQGAIQGIIQGYADASRAGGRTLEKNEVIRPAGLELLCQECRQGGYLTTVLTQLTRAKLEQVVISYPPSERETAVAMAIGVFTPVPPPPAAAKRSSAYEEGVRTGRILGQLMIYLAIFVTVSALIIIPLVRKKRRQGPTIPPPLP